MKRRLQWQRGHEALELIEEAFHLLRQASALTLLCYYVGAVPFVLGLLFFLADMSRGVLTSDRVAASALGVALLFLWMKVWQTVYAQRLLAQVCGERAPRWTVGRWLRAALVQTIVQPWGLFLLPPAAVLLAPLAWVYGFFQNVTVLGAGENAAVRTVVRQAWRQARLWSSQSNVVLVAMKVFVLFVLSNLCVAVLAVPFLLKTLLGMETALSRIMQSPVLLLGFLFSSTFLTAVCGLAYLCVDPLLKAVFALRCFYGESLHTGQDLVTELRRADAAERKAAALALAASLFALSGMAASPSATASHAERPIAVEAGETVSPAELDRTIDRVIRQREYAWRMPREQLTRSQDVEQTTSRAWLDSVLEWIGARLKDLGRGIDRLFQKLFPSRTAPNLPNVSLAAWADRLRILFVALAVVLVVVLALLIYRAWRRRQRDDEVVTGQAAPPAVDLNDENVGADQLPEDGWVTLARDLLSRGELRLALRALYLGSLAHLAGRSLLTLAKFKSNRDYERELGRRSHALPELAGAFSENVAAFDRAWYGLHEVNREVLDRFSRNVERIKARA